MILITANLSGKSWWVNCVEWWLYSLYTPWFVVSLNIHPNRFRQSIEWIPWWVKDWFLPALTILVTVWVFTWIVLGD
jgi:hypothetical protein